MTQLVLGVLEPNALEATLMALDDYDRRRSDRLRALDLEVERATHTEGRMRRQYDRVEPENRLVARELERRWNAAMAELEAARRARERKIASLPAALTQLEKADVRRTLVRLPALWHASTTTPQDRKEVARLLIRHVEASVDANRRLQYTVAWATGHTTRGDVKLPRSGQHRWTTPEADIDLVKRLAVDHSDAEIAAHLSRGGRTTPHGHAWTAYKVQSVRNSHSIPKSAGRPPEFVGWTHAKRTLGISLATFRDLVAKGKLQATQVAPHARWRVSRADVERLAAERGRQVQG